MFYYFSYIVVAEDKPIEKVEYADFRDTKYPKDLKELLYNYCIRLDVKIPLGIIAKFKFFFRREQEQEEKNAKIREAVQLAHLKELKREIKQIRITLDPNVESVKKGFPKGIAFTKGLLARTSVP